MNKDEVMEQLNPILHTEVRHVQHTPRTRVIVNPDMVLLRPGSGGRLVPLDEDGVKAMTNFIGLPSGVIRKLTSDTFGRAATELLARKGRYNLLLDGGQVRDFADYQGVRQIQAERLLTTIEKSIPGTEFHRVTIMENYSAMIEVVGERRQPVVRGDLIRAGAMVTFSPIGTIQPLVQSHVLRLACTNGMTSNNIVRQFEGGGGEGDDIWQFFRHSLRDAYQALDPIVNRYREMTKERIPADQRAMMLEAMLQEAKITGDDADVVRARAIEDPPRNTYDLVNLITWASSHIIREPHRIRRAMSTAASFTSQAEHAQICPLCHSRRR